MEIKTYGELKNALPETGTGRVPGYKQLREKANLFLKKETEDGIIEIYDNGYFIFERQGHETVYGVDRCNGRELYAEVAGDDEELNFDNYPWEVILEEAGAVRLDHVRDGIESYHGDFSLDEPGVENDIKFSVMPEHEIREKEEEEAAWRAEQKRWMKEAMMKPTKRQAMIAKMYFQDHLSQREIATRIGRSQQDVSKAIRRFVEVANKNFR